MTPATLRLCIEAAAIAVLLAAFGLYTYHERSVGAEKVHTADAKAQDEARKRADAETALNFERAKRADEGAANAQAAVDADRAAHPLDPIRVCHAHDRLVVSAQGGGLEPSAPSAGAESATLSQVPGGSAGEGPDIAPELDTILQSASRLAVLYADLQKRN